MVYYTFMNRPAPLGVHSPLINSDIFQTLEEEGCDPIRIMAMIANGAVEVIVPQSGEKLAIPVEISERLNAAKELAQYLYPKKRSLDLRASGKLAVTYNIVNFSEVMPDQAAQLAEQTQQMIDNRPRTKAEVRQLARMTPVNSAALVEAMRHDVETLVVDEDGIIDV